MCPQGTCEVMFPVKSPWQPRTCTMKRPNRLQHTKSRLCGMGDRESWHWPHHSVNSHHPVATYQALELVLQLVHHISLYVATAGKSRPLCCTPNRLIAQPLCNVTTLFPSPLSCFHLQVRQTWQRMLCAALILKPSPGNESGFKRQHCCRPPCDDRPSGHPPSPLHSTVSGLSMEASSLPGYQSCATQCNSGALTVTSDRWNLLFLDVLLDSCRAA